MALTPEQVQLHKDHQRVTKTDGNVVVKTSMLDTWPDVGLFNVCDAELALVRDSGRTFGLLPLPCIGNTATPDVKAYDSRPGHQPKQFAMKGVNITESQVKQLMG